MTLLYKKKPSSLLRNGYGILPQYLQLNRGYCCDGTSFTHHFLFLVPQEKEAILLSSDCNLAKNFFTASPKSRRQTHVVKTLTEMIGKNI